MPLKLVEVTSEMVGQKVPVANDEGNPIYTTDNNAEVGYDGEKLATRVNELNTENTKNAKAAQEAATKLKAFEGIDADKARSALDTVANLNDKKLIEAGEVEKVKGEAIKATKAQYDSLIEQTYKPLEKKAAKLEAALHEEKIGGRFARSKFISEKIAIPAPLMRKSFGEHFTIEEGAVVARHTSGEEIYSRKNAGEKADFDEALEILVDSSPYRDDILKSSGKGGTGGKGSGGGGGGGKQMNEADFQKLQLNDPQAAQKLIGEGIEII